MRLKNLKITVTGGDGFLGKYVVEELKNRGVKKIFVPTHKKYDLRSREVCTKIAKKSDVIIHLAAQIGGIGFINKNPGEIFYNNAIMGIELMEAARKANVKKFVTIGTVCEYPKNTPMPFKEKDLWNGYPESTTAPYGWAKKILIVQSDAYRKQYNFNSIHLLPVNLYGPRDNFQKELAHVIPALIKRFINARDNNEKHVEVWGSGKATREFLYVEDAARAIVIATEKYNSSEPLNLGTGVETSIKEVAEVIAKITGFEGQIKWSKDKPDGQPRRQLSITRAKKLGFTPKIKLYDGLERTIKWYEEHKK